MADTAKRITFEKPGIEKSLLAFVGKDDALHIARARKHGFEAYEVQDVPVRVGHVWKRTRAQQFVPNVSYAMDAANFMVSHSNGEANEIQFLCGADLFITLTEEAQKAGVEVTGLKESPAQIGTAVPPSQGYFEALNQTLWGTGIFLRIPRGVQLKAPLYVNVHTDGRYPFIRMNFVLEEGASATLIERIDSSSHSGHTVMVSEVSLFNGASLSHALIFNQNAKDTLHYTHGCNLGSSAGLNMAATSVGGGTVKACLSGNLVGERAHSEIRTFGVVQDNAELGFHTRQHHVAPKTISDMKSRSVLLDKAVSSNTGLIRIEEEARDCEAYQISRNLMLSKEAEATAIPELEIENNDVICSHGAATGTLDLNQLFYLQSRGLSEGAATRLIVEGSMDALLEGQPDVVQQLFKDAHERVFERLENRK
ncbi:MAG: SufD family Fe-S cluster assembly protein [Deltaproteobacteria bacterium]|nr:SufD family Fe-S cluster assembly protein [Deltaproteobacteria bacterium]